MEETVVAGGGGGGGAAAGVASVRALRGGDVKLYCFSAMLQGEHYLSKLAESSTAPSLCINSRSNCKPKTPSLSLTLLSWNRFSVVIIFGKNWVGKSGRLYQPFCLWTPPGGK